MKVVVGFDSGEYTGYAVLVDSVLSKCGLLQVPDWTLNLSSWHDKVGWSVGHHEVRCLTERPVIYPGGKASPKDIITLALRAGEVAGKFEFMHGTGSNTYVEPSEWKRSLGKSVCHRRVRKLLSEPEVAALERGLAGLPEKRKLDVLDAVGIALFGVGRRVFR